MTDNISVTEGSGRTVATDEIEGVDYQRVKVTFGGDGTALDVAGTAPLPVTGGTTGFIPGTASGALGKAVGGTMVAGATGVMAMGIHTASGTALAGTAYGQAPIQFDTSGAVRVAVDALPVLSGTSDSISAAADLSRVMNGTVPCSSTVISGVQTGTAITALLAGTTGFGYRIHNIAIQELQGGTTIAYIKNGTAAVSGTVLGARCVDGGGIALAFSPLGHGTITAGSALAIQLSAAGTVSYEIAATRVA